MTIGSFDDILGPDEDEEDELEEFEELTLEDLEELFENTIDESLKEVRSNKKIWKPKRVLSWGKQNDSKNE